MEALVGEWRANDANETWTFTSVGDSSYQLSHTGEALMVTFEANLLKLDDHLFLDLIPLPESSGNAMLDVTLLTAHTFFKVDVKQNTLFLQYIDDETLMEEIQKEDHAIDFITFPDEKVLITNNTEDLQSFVRHMIEKETVFVPYLDLEKYIE